MIDSYHSYPKVWALGHAGVKELLFDSVIVEEKLDGSQFSFGRFDGELKCRSKGAHINPENPEKMFAEAVEAVKNLNLVDGFTYRAEYLKTPKHNTISYSRIPTNHLMIFDINIGNEDYLKKPVLKKLEAQRIGLECIPLLFEGTITDPAAVVQFLDKESILGGSKIEGIVIKNYSRFGMDKKVLMGKFVREDFKELNGVDWKERNPGFGDFVQKLIVEHKTPARWDKAIQRLRDSGKLTDSPKDIGLLIKSVQDDIQEEEKEAIKDKLWTQISGDFNRGVVRGLPEYYKEYLMKKQFI
jgi:hypothetical protein